MVNCTIRRHEEELLDPRLYKSASLKKLNLHSKSMVELSLTKNSMAQFDVFQNKFGNKPGISNSL